MDASVAIAIGDVELARRRRHHLRRIVERAGGPRHELSRALTPGVRVRAPLAQDLERLAVEGIGEADGIVPIGEVHDIVADVDAVRVGEGADAPPAQVSALAIEDQHRGILALEDVDAVEGIRGDRADIAERLAGRQPPPVLDELIAIASGPNDGHGPRLEVHHLGGMIVDVLDPAMRDRRGLHGRHQVAPA
jgi:hypothetical protein